jgi:hypothetical protein
VQVDYAGSETAYQRNMEIEFNRNEQRYRFLKWGTQAFNGFRVVPPESASFIKLIWNIWRSAFSSATACIFLTLW